MRLEIKGLSELRDRLARLDLKEMMARALAEQAERIAQSVRDGLSSPAGAGSHDRPWAQTGALRDSIGAVADGLQATVGSNDPAASPQEMGTSRLPPRPFLAPVAAGMGPDVAAAVGEAVSRALKGEPGIVQVASDTSRLSFPVPTFPWDGAARDLERWLQRPRVGPVESFSPSPAGQNIVKQEEARDKHPNEATDPSTSAPLPDLPANPDDLLDQGWEEITTPEAMAAGHRSFRNKQTGQVVRADRAKSDGDGFRGRDHYHVLNPDKTSDRDMYLDKNGRPVGRNSKPSHIFPKAEP